MEANALASDDNIDLPAGTYTLSIPGADEDAAATGDLDITHSGAAGSLTITGAGAGTTTIDAAGLDRVFHVLASGDFQLSDVTITGGSVTGDGGGLFNQGTAAVTGTTITGNAATGTGDAVFNSGQSLTLTDNTVSGTVIACTSGGSVERRVTTASKCEYRAIWTLA